MTSPAPTLFDHTMLARNLQRAQDAGHLPPFWEDIAADDLAGRLRLIKRSFTRAGIISFAADRIEAAIRPALADTATITRLPVISAGDLFLEHGELEQDRFDCLLVTSTLEWVHDLPGTLARLRMSLKPDGVLLAAMLGGDTLTELRHAWIQAETSLRSGVSPRIAPFVDVRDAGGLLQRAGLALPVVDTDRLNVRYGRALALMRELKQAGLANALSDRARGLTSPGLMAAACAAYDSANADTDARVRATFQLLYLTGWSPHESQQQSLRPGSAKVRLADALQMTERKLPGN